MLNGCKSPIYCNHFPHSVSRYCSELITTLLFSLQITFSAMSSKDGFSWTKSAGLLPGIPCIGAIQPPTNITGADSAKYDVIVAGAGYSGLTAARDASLAGLSYFESPFV
jgi:hypothetical protein